MSDPRDTRWFIERMPSEKVLRDTLKGDPVDRLLGIAADRAIKEKGFDLAPKDGSDQHQLRDALQLATAAAARVAKDGDAAVLSDEEKAALDLYILIVARPAIFVRDGGVPEEPDNWEEIARDNLDPAIFGDIIAGVGRIETADGVRGGTGFLVADRRVMTNNHVLCFLFGEPVLERWEREPDWFAEQCDAHHKLWQEDETARPRFDLIGEFGSTASKVVRISSIRAHHLEVDMSVVELDAHPDGGQILPLQGSEPKNFKGRHVYVVGYPVQVPRRVPTLVLQRIFGPAPDSLGTKRFSPGLVMDWMNPSNFYHDASTLGGSSGSAVVDFDLGRVVGLHYAGLYEVSNQAVALFKLRQDPLLVANGVQFV